MFLSKRRIGWAGLAAAAGCAAVCALPVLAAVGLGGGAAAAITRFIRPGAELLVGVVVFAVVLGFMAFRVRAKRRAGRRIMTTTEPLIIPEKPGAPIACDMTNATDTPEERLAEYGRLFAHALIGRERTSDGVVFRFAAKPGVPAWAADLARREAACCPFFSFHVSVVGDHVVWRTSSQAGPEAQAFYDELHALPERVGEGLKGLFDRLEERGLPVISPAPGRFTTEGGSPPAPGLLTKVKSACGC